MDDIGSKKEVEESDLMPFPHHFAKQVSALSPDESRDSSAPAQGCHGRDFVTASGIVFRGRLRTDSSG